MTISILVSRQASGGGTVPQYPPPLSTPLHSGFGNGTKNKKEGVKSGLNYPILHRVSSKTI